MIKALMVITMVSGATYEAKLPTMEQCMSEKAPVISQSDVKSAACIPYREDKMPTEIFERFFDFIMMMQEQRFQEDERSLQDLEDRPPFWQPGKDYYPPKP